MKCSEFLFSCRVMIVVSLFLDMLRCYELFCLMSCMWCQRPDHVMPCMPWHLIAVGSWFARAMNTVFGKWPLPFVNMPGRTARTGSTWTGRRNVSTTQRSVFELLGQSVKDMSWTALYRKCLSGLKTSKTGRKRQHIAMCLSGKSISPCWTHCKHRWTAKQLLQETFFQSSSHQVSGASLWWKGRWHAGHSEMSAVVESKSRLTILYIEQSHSTVACLQVLRRNIAIVWALCVFIHHLPNLPLL